MIADNPLANTAARGAGTTYPALHMIIDGEKIPVGHRRTHAVLNPATGAVLGHLPLADAADLDRALETAARGFRIWREAPPQQRAAVLSGAARLAVERQEQIARIATLEEGKTIAEARIEVMMVAGLFNFYAGECQRLYGRQLARPAGMRSTVTYEPVGPGRRLRSVEFPPSAIPAASSARRSQRAAR
jgi:succinate-semialdehyde dehydrogenase/glutarate-semialdehyde dehydrogenase